MRQNFPFTRDLVLIGGGHAHALVLKQWGMNRLPGARVTLINPHPTAPYTGMLPGFVAGHYQRDELDIDLVRLCRSSGVRMTMACAVGLDLERSRVILDRQAPVGFDVLSVNVGITSDLPAMPGFQSNAVPAKPLGLFADEWDVFLKGVSEGSRRPDIAIIGAGVGGVELALAASHRLKAATGTRARIILIERSGAPLSELGRGSRRTLLNRAASAGIDFRCDSEVERIEPGQVVLSCGEVLDVGLVVGASGARPPDWFETTGLDLADGYIRVDETLRSTSHPMVHAAGDCAHMSRHPRSKAGVFAVRSAPVLHQNVRAALEGRQPRPFRPQRNFLKLISTGGKHAVGEKWGIPASGNWVWTVKDRIDRKFMAKFEHLPVMGSQPLPERAATGLRDLIGDSERLCGGCGSKVGRSTLRSGLADVSAKSARHVAVGIGDDAAVLEWNQATQVISTDHLRAFVDDPWLLGRIAAIHALGDVWSMGAAPQAGLAYIVMPRMSDRLAADTQREIMAAAAQVFDEEDAAIVGGHTSMGSELMVGFTVTGIPRDRPITKAGAKPGDILLATRPIGTGTILAGEMAGKARGRDVQGALDAMSSSSGKAARILADYAAAMTDVTGFGLAGHLFEILEASGAAAAISLDRIRVLEGAIPLAEAGIRSTIWKSNAQLREFMTFPCSTVADLLFDPQTAGGLLASIPPDTVDEVCERLGAVGESPVLIGQVDSGAPWITVG